MTQSLGKIDVHHHFVPQAYADALEACGGDPSGWKLPSWSLDATKELMTAQHTTTAILSLTAPGTCIVPDARASAALARTCNLHAASIRDSAPSTFGFFASLPSLLNTADALAEITYSLDTLHADGITLFTRYGPGNTYLGHPSLAPIWAELDRRSAVVFVHPTHAVDTTLVSPLMPQPVIDYPHETTRTAMDLLLSGTIRRHQNVKIILSHAGGTLPYLAARPGSFLPFPGVELTREEFMQDARSFYFDLALSSGEVTLGVLERFAAPGRVLWGSDFPYAPRKGVDWFLKEFEGYRFRDEGMRRSVERGAAETLFPRLIKAERSLL
ncbi:uncharacterized protein LAJ45_01013 [Morchella importuna]|uniref:uncharacterized protein n=1 Tax=Morchella importuna TaxID=1174673 RepID=UPI001E8E610F|nr:uncharacterized protein LAJ45_01013 [Morchella importuna]KAH8154486.1 hypothetical protein LAJ45_01013 [Morchella importuna]